MGSEFVDKAGKPTAEEYLSASIEDVIDRTNKSSNKSEIPFVTALFAAKSHENQRKTSNKMFYVAIITTIIAILSLVQSYYSSVGKAAEQRELSSIKDAISAQERKIIELQMRISDSESEIELLRAQQVEHLGIIENLPNNELKHNKSMQPTADASAD